MKPLYLLSFSLSFLSQGIANDFAREEALQQTEGVEYFADQGIASDGDYLSDARPSSATPSRPAPSQPSYKSQDCLSPYHRFHASIRHNESRGIGYDQGYTTVEAFGIYDGYSSYFMPFFDVRGHVFNNERLAGNLGIGERTLIPSIDHTFGSYLYYDVRRVGHGLTVNQLSPGIELVGRRMEYRINGYFPVGKDKGHQYGYKFADFEGNEIILKSKQYHAMTGFDSEIGAHITQSTKYDLYAAAGPYFFQAPHARSWGGRTRLLGRYKEYVSLEVAYSYDHLFRSRVEGSVAFTLPFGRKLKRTGRGCPQMDDLLLSRASFAPSRFEIPVVKKIHKRDPAINPATGKPWTVWFVDNTSHSAGTYESPFSTLADAQSASSPYDMIYVFPGDGTTTGMDAGITLQNGQSFFGSGLKHKISTSKGQMTIPQYSSSYPSITNTAGNVVLLANGDTVSGFNISVTAGGSGVAGGAVNGAVIENNFIAVNSSGFGIGLNGVGTFNIYGNQIVSPSTFNSAGIHLTAAGGEMSGSINNNFTSTDNVGILLTSPVGFGNYDFTIEGNTTLSNSSGIRAFMSGNSTLNITENSIANRTGAIAALLQILDDSTTTSGNVLIANNQFPNPDASIGINMVLSSPNGSKVNATVINNTVTGPNTSDFVFTASATDTLCLTLNNNTNTGGYALGTFGSGIINVDSLINNVGSPVLISGNVNFVEEGTCGN